MNNICRTELSQELTADGNCLGVALIDAWSLLKVTPPSLDLRNASTPKDAVSLLRHVRQPKLLVSEDSSRIELFFQKRAARRLGVVILDRQGVKDGDVVLCARSMYQLYGIHRHESHWVILRITSAGIEVYDQLWNLVRQTFKAARQQSGAVVLNQIGPTFVV